MNSFYYGIMFIGILMVVIAFVWMIADRRKAAAYLKELENKKEDISNVVKDADVMLEELNKFSDYVLTQLDRKSRDIAANIEHSQAPGQKTQFHKESTSLQASTSMQTAVQAYVLQQTAAGEDQKLPDSKPDNSKGSSAGLKEHLISFNTKHKEVLELSANGLDESEIAKRLSIGKGEVRLILGMNK